MIRLYILKSSVIREAHSVGLELGVGSYEVELHINNRWQGHDVWQWSTCTYWHKLLKTVIPHFGLFRSCGWYTLCTRRVGILYLKSNEKEIPVASCSSLHFDPNREGRREDGRGGSRGSTRTVSTFDNAMPCYRAGYFKHKTHTPTTKIHLERITK